MKWIILIALAIWFWPLTLCLIIQGTIASILQEQIAKYLYKKRGRIDDWRVDTKTETHATIISNFIATTIVLLLAGFVYFTLGEGLTLASILFILVGAVLGGFVLGLPMVLINDLMGFGAY